MVMRGNIAIPSAKSLKRPAPQRKPRTYPENMPVIVMPPPLRRRQLSAAQQQIPIIVEPKRNCGRCVSKRIYAHDPSH